jgi:hypothetical protein
VAVGAADSAWASAAARASASASAPPLALSALRLGGFLGLLRLAGRLCGGSRGGAALLALAALGRVGLRLLDGPLLGGLDRLPGARLGGVVLGGHGGAAGVQYLVQPVERRELGGGLGVRTALLGGDGGAGRLGGHGHGADDPGQQPATEQPSGARLSRLAMPATGGGGSVSITNRGHGSPGYQQAPVDLNCCGMRHIGRVRDRNARRLSGMTLRILAARSRSFVPLWGRVLHGVRIVARPPGA